MLAAVEWIAVRRLAALLKTASGAAIAEFAVALPLLIVLVVGIFDFGGAFNLKQELNNLARQGARFGAAQPTNDLCTACAAPPSVDAIRYLVDSYLTTAKINDCGLNIAALPTTGPPWSYTAATDCGGTLTLTIARDASAGVASPTCLLTMNNYGGATVYAPCTEVIIQYPYQWRFDNVIQLISPGTHFLLSTIQTNATATNQD
ncbi:MAG TPA: TadE/TadG family type IV pilus assembly protein [Terriglobales bacterium]|nr:TadE/TadG family type IV pilus assembly protein [Terriglobales bacterium]